MQMLPVPKSWATEAWIISGSVGSWCLTSSGKRCNIPRGSRLRGGFNPGQYLTGYSQLWNMHCNHTDQAGKAPVVQWMMVKSKYGKAWLIDYSTLPQTCHGQALHAYNDGNNHWMPADIACASRHCPEHHLGTWHSKRTESDNRTYFKNSLIDTWATVLSGWNILPCHAPATGKIELYNRLLKTTLKAMSGRTIKHWEMHLAKAT